MKALPQRWTTARLGDLCTIKTGKRDVNEGAPTGKYPFFTCAQDVYRIDEYAFEGESILVAGNGFFNVKYYDGKFDAYQRTYVLQNFITEGKFLYHYIQFKLDEITKDNRGSTIRYIRLGDLTEHPVPVAPCLEQHRIVMKLEKVLGTVQDSQKRLTKIPVLLKRFRQSVLAAACSGRLTADWRTGRETSSDVRKLYDAIKDKDDENLREIPVEIPVDWIVVGFYDVAEVKSNLVNPKDYQDFPHIAPDNIEKETGKLLPYRTIKEDRVKSPKHLFSKGQIIYSKIRPYLSKAIIAGFDGLCSADMYPIRSKINVWFLFYYILSPYFLELASTAGDRSVLPKINQDELGKIPVPLPSIAEQEEIVRRVESLFKLVDQIEARYNKAKTSVDKLTQSILAKAFRGELVPQDPNDEPASVLLEKIKRRKTDA